MKWSVIIPTLWKPKSFLQLLQELNSSNWVSEIILIDNNPQDCPSQVMELEKIVHVPQAQNIYVNPAWNLGAQLAKNEWICICNDDVLFNSEQIFKFLAMNPPLGILGIHPKSFDPETWNNDIPQHSQKVHIKEMWACALFLEKKRFVQIPDEMKIWWGDAWLAWYARPATSMITKVITKHSESVDNPQFHPITERDTELWDGHLKPFPLRAIEWKTALLHRIQSKLRRTFPQA